MRTSFYVGEELIKLEGGGVVLAWILGPYVVPTPKGETPKRRNLVNLRGSCSSSLTLVRAAMFLQSQERVTPGSLDLVRGGFSLSSFLLKNSRISRD